MNCWPDKAATSVRETAENGIFPRTMPAPPFFRDAGSSLLRHDRAGVDGRQGGMALNFGGFQTGVFVTYWSGNTFHLSVGGGRKEHH